MFCYFSRTVVVVDEIEKENRIKNGACATIHKTWSCYEIVMKFYN